MKNLYKLLSFIFFVPLILSSCKKERHDLEFSVDLLNTNDLIKEIIEEIQTNYADDIAREKLEIGAINGMLQVLDEYSLYMPNDEFNAYNQTTRGMFLGLGIEIKQIAEGLEIHSVIDESPAANAGIRPLDIITQIDDKSVSKMSPRQIASRLGADSALKVKLLLLRNKNETFEVNIQKSVIQLRSVKTEFLNDIAIIKINYFNDGTLNAVSQAIKKINKKKPSGVIIDLRNNPGGLFEQAIGVADLFLSNKKIVEIKSRNIEESKVIFSDETDLLNNLPMVVLINSNTASGAELLASALGENKRAVLIGEKTYGKGSMQTIIPIPGRGAIKLTTAYFISPNGNSISHKGIIPDVEIKQEQSSLAQDSAILRAIDLLHGLTALTTDTKKP